MHAAHSFHGYCEVNAALNDPAMLSLTVLAKGALLDDMFPFSVIDSLSKVGSHTFIRHTGQLVPAGSGPRG